MKIKRTPRQKEILKKLRNLGLTFGMDPFNYYDIVYVEELMFKKFPERKTMLELINEMIENVLPFKITGMRGVGTTKMSLITGNGKTYHARAIAFIDKNLLYCVFDLNLMNFRRMNNVSVFKMNTEVAQNLLN